MEIEIMAFYDEAVRRLPIADMPELEDCILSSGHCIGLLDPVSNIILNALNLLCRRRCSSESALPRRGRKREGKRSSAVGSSMWITIAFRSYAGLVAFMRTYFRYLSMGQALRYLRLAGADLAVAVQLGEHQQFGPVDRHSPDLCCGRTQFALKVAAAIAGHPEPGDLAQLAKSLAPFKDEKDLAAVLKKGQLLSLDDINSIVSSLQRQHYAASPAVQVSFLRRPHPDFDQGFGLPGQQPSKFSVVSENYIADVTISRNDAAVSSICDLRTPDEMKLMLANCLDLAATTIGKCYPPHMTMDHATAPPIATCECEHTRYLKMCLADTIHAFYIKALSLLAHHSLHKHLRGILVAGHCYGPMDPVSNIILNAIWYNTVCPLPEIDTETEPDILDSKSLLRMEVRSLNGLVAMLSTATSLSEHEAIEYLCYEQCDLSVVLQMASQQTVFKAYDCAGQAGKHPNHSELASFLISKCSNGIQGLRTLLIPETTGKNYVISDTSLEQVHKILKDQSMVPSVDHPRLSPMAWMMLGTRKQDFVQQQRFLRQILDKLLLDYSNQHPWEPTHRLDVICGTKTRNFEHSKCCHINFLAYCDDDASNVVSARILFFAEVWLSSSKAKAKPSKPNSPVEMNPVPCPANGHRNESYSHTKLYCKSGQMKSTTSFCCPLPHYKVDCPYLGRCTICEPTSSKIVHPPTGKHAGANSREIGDLLDYLNSIDEHASVVDCVTDSDFIYFDCVRDTEFAKVLNGKSSLKMKKQMGS